MRHPPCPRHLRDDNVHLSAHTWTHPIPANASMKTPIMSADYMSKISSENLKAGFLSRHVAQMTQFETGVIWLGHLSLLKLGNTKPPKLLKQWALLKPLPFSNVSHVLHMFYALSLLLFYPLTTQSTLNCIVKSVMYKKNGLALPQLNMYLLGGVGVDNW